VAGAILLGSGVTFSLVGFTTLVGRAGHTTIGDQGLITFDPVGVDLQWRIPRAMMGFGVGAVGATLSGIGGSFFARNAVVPGDPVTSLKRIRRARMAGAASIGVGSAILLSGLVLFGGAAGEWNSIPASVAGLEPEHIQSAHNTAVFAAWGSGLATLGLGVASAGLGLLTGTGKAKAKLGLTAGRTGGGFVLSKRF
jgi:hypothetical protein